MAETQAWRASGIRQAYGERSATDSGGSRRHRAGARIWALLRAPALLRGAADDPHDLIVMFIEDDYRRLAARRTR